MNAGVYVELRAGVAQLVVLLRELEHQADADGLGEVAVAMDTVADAAEVWLAAFTPRG